MTRTIQSSGLKLRRFGNTPRLWNCLMAGTSVIAINGFNSFFATEWIALVTAHTSLLELIKRLTAAPHRGSDTIFIWKMLHWPAPHTIHVKIGLRIALGELWPASMRSSSRMLPDPAWLNGLLFMVVAWTQMHSSSCLGSARASRATMISVPLRGHVPSNWLTRRTEPCLPSRQTRS